MTGFERDCKTLLMLNGFEQTGYRLRYRKGNVFAYVHRHDVKIYVNNRFVNSYGLDDLRDIDELLAKDLL